MGRRRRRAGVAGNTLILTAGTVVQTVIALVTVPLYLGQLGQERFGVWVIAGVVVAYFGLIDRGLGTAVVNEVARLGDRPGERASIVWTAVLFNAAVGLAAAVGVLVLGWILFTRVIEIPASLEAESLAALPELAASVPLVSVSAILQGSLFASGRIATVSVLETLRLLGLQLLPLGFVYWQGPDLRWLAVGVLTALALSTLAYLGACLLLVLRERLWATPSRAVAMRLFHYGKWVTATSILTPILDFSDRVVIGAISGSAAVTAYSIPYNLTSRLTTIPFNVIRVAFPRFSAASAQESRAQAKRALAGIAAITAPAAVAGSILAGPFFEWWLGGDIAREAAPIAAVLFAAFWINGIGFVPSSLLQAQGRPDQPARFHALELLPFLAVLGLAVHIAGPMGAAVAWLLRTLADALLLLVVARIDGWRDATTLGTAAVVGVAAVVGAVFAFENTVLVAVGVPLTLLSLVLAWYVAPEEARTRARGVLRPRRSG